MPESDQIPLRLNRHLIKCPRCGKHGVRDWPGEKILFAPAKCAHCGEEFVIAMNQSRPALSRRT
jgi:ribosomal protein S27AE